MLTTGAAALEVFLSRVLEQNEVQFVQVLDLVDDGTTHIPAHTMISAPVLLSPRSVSPVHAAVLPRAHGRPVPHLRAAELDHPRPERRLSHISVIVIQFLNYLLDEKLLLQLDPVAVLQLDDPVILHQAGAAVAVVGGPVDVRAAIFNRLYLCITLLTIITCCITCDVAQKLGECWKLLPFYCWVAQYLGQVLSGLGKWRC